MRRTAAPVVFTLMLALTPVFIAAQSADSWLGVWKVNTAKSKYSPGLPPKLTISTWEALPGGLKVTTYTVSATGSSSYLEVLTNMDGKDVPVKGAAANTTRSYKRTGAGNYEYTTRVDGKVTTTTTQVVSRDGMTRTNITTGKDAQGRTVNNTVVYEKQ